MSATDELRRLLDERGVGWDYGASGSRSTEFMVNGRDLCFNEFRHGMICTTILTPEQVVKVMVGKTCHIVKTWSDSDYDEDWCYHCSECGCPIPVDERDPETGDVISAANFCPHCGRRVVE